MYNSLTGILSYKKIDSVGIQISGVEWSLLVSNNCLLELGTVGSNAKVYTYLHHKEDVLELFGFLSEEERSLFLNLISISGVGPKLALKILSSLALNDLLIAIESNNLSVLSKISGIGTKTAQKILLHLQGKLITPDESYKETNELADALANMGYDKNKINKLLPTLLAKAEIQTLPTAEKEVEIMRQAIISLSQ